MFLFSQDLTTSAAGQAFGSEKLPSPEEFTVKMGALLRVFTTVVDSLGENLVPARNKITKEFSCKVGRCLLCLCGALSSSLLLWVLLLCCEFCCFPVVSYVALLWVLLLCCCEFCCFAVVSSVALLLWVLLLCCCEFCCFVVVSSVALLLWVLLWMNFSTLLHFWVLVKGAVVKLQLTRYEKGVCGGGGGGGTESCRQGGNIFLMACYTFHIFAVVYAFSMKKILWTVSFFVCVCVCELIQCFCCCFYY